VPEQTVADQDEEISDLRQQLALLKKAVYSQKSEKTEYIAENMEQTKRAVDLTFLLTGPILPYRHF
jgi:hypothetical protein